MSVISDFGMHTSTYPVVSEGPDAVKLNSLLTELKVNSDIVEFEVTENCFFSSSGVDATLGVNAKLTIVLASLIVAFPSHLALTR